MSKNIIAAFDDPDGYRVEVSEIGGEAYDMHPGITHFVRVVSDSPCYLTPELAHKLAAAIEEAAVETEARQAEDDTAKAAVGSDSDC